MKETLKKRKNWIYDELDNDTNEEEQINKKRRLILDNLVEHQKNSYMSECFNCFRLGVTDLWVSLNKRYDQVCNCVWKKPPPPETI